MDTIKRILSSLVSKDNTHDSLFDQLVVKCLEHYDAPVHSIQEIRSKRNTKVKGDLFEAFCILYLTHKGYQAWLLKEVPDDILTQFGMKRFDVGIDIIALKDGRYSAVQCKFKKPRPGFVKGTWLPYNCVNWKELSTFYSLCQRTQTKARWERHIVMTNTKNVRRMGNATQYDKTFAYGTFQALTRIQLSQMLLDQSESTIERTIILENEDGTETDVTYGLQVTIRTVDEMRAARIAKFEMKK